MAKVSKQLKHEDPDRFMIDDILDIVSQYVKDDKPKKKKKK